MAFESVPGLPGKVYKPGPSGIKPKRHHCTDCFSCQHCSEDRCSLCCDQDSRRTSKHNLSANCRNETGRAREKSKPIQRTNARAFKKRCMETKPKLASSCCNQSPASSPDAHLTPDFPMQTDPQGDEVCCGRPPAPPSSPMEKPGYRLQAYVTGFIDTATGPVPRVKTELDRIDRMGSFAVRLGIRRSDYAIAPGLYAVGRPEASSPVLVSSNYKLSFDTLRKSLASLDVWILVLDTRGINVWCAAGKQLFSTDELVQRLKQTRSKRLSTIGN